MVQRIIRVEESRFTTLSLAGEQSVMILGIVGMVMSFAVLWDSLVQKK